MASGGVAETMRWLQQQNLPARSIAPGGLEDSLAEFRNTYPTGLQNLNTACLPLMALAALSSPWSDSMTAQTV